MLKRYSILILSCFLLLNCTKKEEVKKEVYIISEQDTIRKTNAEEGKLTPPPPPGLYGLSHVVIDKKGDFYFYQRDYRFIWGCIVEENPIPEFINLQPKNLVRIPGSSVADFLKANTATKIKEKRGGFIIASQLDTLKSEGFFNLMHFVHNYKESQIAVYLIRRTTQEEDVVLQFKKNDSLYDSDSIKWDKRRIKFID